MSEEKEQDGGVKVVDRRRIDEDGETRNQEQTASAVAAEASAASEASASAPPPDAAPEPSGEPSTSDDPAGADSADAAESAFQALPPIDFTAFVQSLAQQALMLMGVLPHPESGERVRELALARQTVDLLQMLHEKTQGNLTDDEKRLLEALLHDLRLAFVQLSQ